MSQVLRLTRNKQAAASFAKRGFVSAASPSSAFTTTKNGVRVAAIPDSVANQLASVSVVLNNGSRFETATSAGAAHYLKDFAFRNSKKRTAFRKIREAELQGAMLSSEVTRENIIYTIECLKQDVPYFLDQLAEMTTSTLFNEWEFDEIQGHVQLEADIARANPHTLVLENLHKAAFRSGLGNSLFASHTSPISSSSEVEEYFNARFGSNSVAVIGTGISSSDLASLVEQTQLSSLSNNAAVSQLSKSKFYQGAEIHVDASAEHTHYAIAFQAPNPSTASLLAEYLGTNSHVKWCNGISPLGSLSTKLNANISAFSQSYSDVSFVGVNVVASSENIASAVSATINQIKSSTNASQLNAAAFERASSSSAMKAAIASETISGQRSTLSNAIFSSEHKSDAVDANIFASAAASVFAQKPTVASVGNTLSVPYLDTL
ncbi:hypothetical protein BB561_006778 [Smittium simulii]|uniref:Cytochrome b-c1 complex subunit 2, mitochondrial n=1 Tax=Smittium simulii TaxID=133385 RepID=A0A2T9Y1S4_9FUNG|nr:hypothetical protein BB561_006778 [Smittium simulii]